jgi:hypothetical protein
MNAVLASTLAALARIPFHAGPHDGPVLHLFAWHLPLGAVALLAAAAFGFALRRRLPGGDGPHGRR